MSHHMNSNCENIINVYALHVIICFLPLATHLLSSAILLLMTAKVGTSCAKIVANFPKVVVAT